MYAKVMIAARINKLTSKKRMDQLHSPRYGDHSGGGQHITPSEQERR